MFILLSCEKEVLLNSSAKLKVQMISGNDQTGISERKLSEPLVVQVLNDKGEGIANVPISWYVDSELYISPNEQNYEFRDYLQAETFTDEDGFARAFWFMEEPGPHELKIEVLDILNRAIEGSGLTFSATSLHVSHSYKVVSVSGENQFGKVLTPLSEPFVLKVLDDQNEPVRNQEVRWSSSTSALELKENINFSGANLVKNGNEYTGETNWNGEIGVDWILGPEPGIQTLTAELLTNDGTQLEGSPLSFSVEAADLDITLLRGKGNNQSTAITTGLPVPVSLKLIDEFGNPVSGYKITWTSDDPDYRLESVLENDEFTSLQDSYSTRSIVSGWSSVRWIQGNTVGDFSLTATVLDSKGNHVSGSPLIFNATTFAKGQLTDSRDGQVYTTINYNGVEWMVENLNYKTALSVCYDDLTENCDEFGSLYIWEEAKLACPSGWHLGSDAEWQALEVYLGIPAGVADDFGSRSTYYDSLGVFEGEWTGLEMKGGGYYTDEYGYSLNRDDPELNYYGYTESQWTSTPYNAERSIERLYSTLWGDLGRYADSTQYKFSVRCVKD